MYQCNPSDWAMQVEENANTMTPDEFISWFEGGETIEGAYNKAEGIFNRLILPIASKHLKDLSNKVSLDVGYGNGGLALCASNSFEVAYGVEWHDSAEAIGVHLEGTKHRNVVLVHSPQGLNIQDDTIDFLFSWLYVNRLGTIGNLFDFLIESYRVMKERSVGVIFFSRYRRSGRAQTPKEYDADVFAENQDKIGFREGGSTTRIKGISIVLSLWKMTELLTEAGFKVVGQTASYDGKGKRKVYHGQHGLVFLKGTFEKKKAPEKKSQTKKSKKSALKRNR